MPKINLVFINKDVGFGRQCVPLQGYSGVVYGTASWDSVFAGHAIRIPAEEWNFAKADDISRTCHMPMCRWITGVPEIIEDVVELPEEPPAEIPEEPPVEVPDRPPAQPPTEDAPEAPAKAPSADPVAAIAEAMTSEPAPAEPAAETEVYTAESLASLTFMQLMKIAKAVVGVEGAQAMNTSAELRAAILAK